MAVTLQGTAAPNVYWRGHAPAPHPSLHPTRYGGLRSLPYTGELKRQAAHR